MLPARTTRFVIGALVAVVGALACPPASWAWSWPVDGAVLQGFHVGDDKYAAGQHRGIDIAFGDDAGNGGAGAVRAPVAGRRDVRGHGSDSRSDRHDRDGRRAQGVAHTPRTVGRQAWRTSCGGRRGRCCRSERRPRARGRIRPPRSPRRGWRVLRRPAHLLPPRAAPTSPPAPAAPPAPVPAEAPPPPSAVASPEPPSQVGSPPPPAAPEPPPGPGPEGSPVAEPARDLATADSAGAIVADVARSAEGVQAPGSRRPAALGAAPYGDRGGSRAACRELTERAVGGAPGARVGRDERSAFRHRSGPSDERAGAPRRSHAQTSSGRRGPRAGRRRVVVAPERRSRCGLVARSANAVRAGCAERRLSRVVAPRSGCDARRLDPRARVLETPSGIAKATPYHSRA